MKNPIASFIVIILLVFYSCITGEIKELASIVKDLAEVDVLNSSSYTIEEVGKEEFGRDGGDVELGDYLLPDDEFITRFSSVSEIYHYVAYFKHHWSIIFQENWVVVLQYEPSVYEEAKAYCLDQMRLRDIGVPDYKDYQFLENTELAEKQHNVDKDGSLLSFPKRFNMFAFNDTDHKLAFIGFYYPDYRRYDYDDREEVLNDWASFVEENFPELWQEMQAS